MSNKYTLILEWENDKFFEMRSKKDNDSPILVIRTEENTHYADTRVFLENVCRTFFEKKLKEIGDLMIV